MPADFWFPEAAGVGLKVELSEIRLQLIYHCKLDLNFIKLRVEAGLGESKLHLCFTATGLDCCVDTMVH